jgi:AmmeMemoRadiSam system protein B
MAARGARAAAGGASRRIHQCRVTRCAPCRRVPQGPQRSRLRREPEHALEVELPFLQIVLPSFSLVPLVVGDAAAQEVADVLARLWSGPETLLVVSSDLSHYHSYEIAQRLDAATSAAIEEGDWASLGPGQACGYLPIAGLIVEANRRNLKARRLSMCNSGDTAGARDQVVGYGAWAFD